MRHDLRLSPHACCLSSELLTCCQDGNVAVYNLQKESRAPVYLSTPVNGKHLDTVWQVGFFDIFICVIKFSKIGNTSWRASAASKRAKAAAGRVTHYLYLKGHSCYWKAASSTWGSQLLLDGPRLLLEEPRLLLEGLQLLLEGLQLLLEAFTWRA